MNLRIFTGYFKFNFTREKKDYCTMFFDTVNDSDISGCCRIHDADYEDQNCTRLEADEFLRDCVNCTSGTEVGNMMFFVVRKFGGVFWKWHQIKKKLDWKIIRKITRYKY